MVHNKPFVSIGMPVYNGARYIRQALDSLLAQDYENFELIISDNASTDRTQEICLEYAARDKRIRYYRNQTNMGLWNANRVFELSSGEYFMWAAHDDYWDPRYVRSCIEAFGTSETIILTATICDNIEPETEELIAPGVVFSTIGMSPCERFMRYKSLADGDIATRYVGTIFCGVYKRSALHKVMPLKNVFASDMLLLAELCLQGDIVTVEERLMFKRCGGVSLSMEKLIQSLDISNQLLKRCPYVVREILLHRIIFQADRLTLLDKIKLACWCHSHSFKLFVIRTLRLGYRTLQAFAKRLALRARGLWRSAARRMSVSSITRD